MFWKIYFIFILANGVYNIVIGKYIGDLTSDLILNTFALVGLFGYSFKKYLFVEKFWRAFFYIYLVYLIWAYFYQFSENWARGIVGFVLMLPTYLALYLYTFKFLKNKNEGKINEERQNKMLYIVCGVLVGIIGLVLQRINPSIFGLLLYAMAFIFLYKGSIERNKDRFKK